MLLEGALCLIYSDVYSTGLRIHLSFCVFGLTKPLSQYQSNCIFSNIMLKNSEKSMLTFFSVYAYVCVCLYKT